MSQPLSYCMLLLLLAIIQTSFESNDYHKNAHIKVRSRATTKNEREADQSYWANEARAGIEALLRSGLGGESGGKARNLVMFLGDGMSVPTLAAARTLLGQRRGLTGEEAALSFEKFPTLGLAKTYCVDGQVPDSACTSTAYLCGSKTNVGTLGVSARVLRGSCEPVSETDHVSSIATWALADGRDAGIVTNTQITDASPAGAFAHIAERDWESDADAAAACAAAPQDIAAQLITENPGKQFKVILGSGRREFLPKTTIDEEGTHGKRLDGRNLIEEWQMDKISRNVSYQYVWNREQLINANEDLPEYLLGLFDDSHLPYNLQANPATDPILAELTEVAIRSLSRNEKGFFLFIEGGRIDHAHHDNYVELALDETIQLAAAVERATELLDEKDSLIIVTSDHAHVMTFSGYTQRGGDILGQSEDRGDDGVPYMTLSYANGPGYRPHEGSVRADVTREPSYRQLEWRSHTEVPLESETHGGDDVAVFARGTHHAMFTGMCEQSQIPHRMAYVACIGNGRTLCDEP